LIYLDSSVLPVRRFADDRSPPNAFWSQTFVASRLLEFEVFNLDPAVTLSPVAVLGA
jgi:hypothetical protein